MPILLICHTLHSFFPIWVYFVCYGNWHMISLFLPWPKGFSILSSQTVLLRRASEWVAGRGLAYNQACLSHFYKGSLFFHNPCVFLLISSISIISFLRGHNINSTSYKRCGQPQHQTTQWNSDTLNCNSYSFCSNFWNSACYFWITCSFWLWETCS